MVILGARGPGHAYRPSKPEHVQHLQLWEDKTNEVIMVLEANIDIMMALCRFYHGLRNNKDVPQSLKDGCNLDTMAFAAQIKDMVSDFKMQIALAKLLVKIITDRKEMVSHILPTMAPRLHVSGLCSNRNHFLVGYSAPSKPGDRENGKTQLEHGERSNRDADHHHCDFGVFAGYVCLCKS